MLEWTNTHNVLSHMNLYAKKFPLPLSKTDSELKYTTLDLGDKLEHKVLSFQSPNAFFFIHRETNSVLDDFISIFKI